MLELKTEHIEQIANYFIVVNEEEKALLMNTITPLFLKGFLKDLKNLFILEPDNEAKLISIARSMGASKHIEALKEIQQQFYSQQAEIYLSGQTNADNERLLERNNELFLNEVAYQKETASALRLIEREELKNLFQEVENETVISDEEMKVSFEQIERERLKGKFRQLEQGKKVYPHSDVRYQLASESLAEEPLVNETQAINKEQFKVIKGRFNWKRLAVAAAVIGLISTTTFLFLDQRKTLPPDVAANKPEVDTPVTNKNPEIQTQRANILALLGSIPSDEMETKILKETAFGFAEKDEYLKVDIRYIGDYLKAFKDSAEKISDRYQLEANKKTLDSLNNLINKYRLDEGTLLIYLATKQQIKVFKIDSNIYLMVGNTVYDGAKSERLRPLKKVTDHLILEEIDKILFNESE